jgi:hypothetical protein
MGLGRQLKSSKGRLQLLEPFQDQIDIMSTDVDTMNEFWLSYLHSQGGRLNLASPEAGGFGDNPSLADELGRLIKSGVKTATCSLLWEYEAGDEKIPQVGELFIVTDGYNRPPMHHRNDTNPYPGI